MRLAAAIVLLLLAGNTVCDEHPAPPKPALQATSGTAPQTNTGKPLSAPEHGAIAQNAPISISITAPEGHEAKESTAEWVTAWGTLALAGVTFLLFVGTAFLAWFTYKLWKKTGDLVEETNDEAKRGLRAYVAVEEIYFAKGGVKVRIKNYGKTPAHEVTLWSNSATSEPPHDFAYPYNGDPMVDEQMLHPLQTYARALPLGFSPTLVTRAYFPYGRIVYRDIYARWWSTHFCYLAEGEGAFVPWGNHNKEEEHGAQRPY
jgi:hypothetical protein